MLFYKLTKLCSLQEKLNDYVEISITFNQNNEHDLRVAKSPKKFVKQKIRYLELYLHYFNGSQQNFVK